MPAYLMDCSLRAGGPDSVKLRREALTELFAVHRLLGTVANNVNQLVKHANTTGEVRAETTAALRHARRVMDRIDASIEELAL